MLTTPCRYVQPIRDAFKIYSSYSVKSHQAVIMSTPDITLYTAVLPMAGRFRLLLRSSTVNYKVHPISFAKNEQKEEWFLKYNGDFPVFESGAILLYLAEHYDPDHKILSADPRKKIPYAINRYRDETIRLYKTLERAFVDGRDYIAGDFSVADLTCFGWAAYAEKSGANLDETPLVKKWLLRVLERPSIIKGANVPTETTLLDEVKAKLSAK
ncbi:hypothetical protein BC829DRAFT_409196 [Chytridium lagenaria]|nr:hypothetical protein BC829DRAFT_409196 [Chytridium lagenaria]